MTVTSRTLDFVELDRTQIAFARRAVEAAKWRWGIASVQGEMERIRERIERASERGRLLQARAGRDVCWPTEDTEPLVTIRIATFRRAGLLMERSLASALRQTYERLDILIVGDCTDADTSRVLAKVTDRRVRFVNLPFPSLYPLARGPRNAVSGSVPMTVGNMLAQGAWVAPCDDDDELTDDHVEVLLAHAQRHRLEFVHSQTSRETTPGQWSTIGSERLSIGQVTAGSVMHSTGLRFMPYSLTCWKLPEPHDWNLWRRMRDIGVRMGYLDRVTYRYHIPDHDANASPLLGRQAT